MRQNYNKSGRLSPELLLFKTSILTHILPSRRQNNSSYSQKKWKKQFLYGVFLCFVLFCLFFFKMQNHWYLIHGKSVEMRKSEISGVYLKTWTWATTLSEITVPDPSIHWGSTQHLQKRTLKKNDLLFSLALHWITDGLFELNLCCGVVNCKRVQPQTHVEALP